jgi:hypothetical protein
MILIGPAPREGEDQHDELQAWVDSAQPGDVLKLRLVGPKGARELPTYRCEDTLRFNFPVGVRMVNPPRLKRTALIGSAPGPSGRNEWHPQVSIVMARDCLLRFAGLHSVGTGTYDSTYESEHAVRIRGGERLQLEVGDIEAPASEWVNIAHHEPGGQQRIEAIDILVSRWHDQGRWTKAGRQGLSITGRVDRVTFSGLDLGRAPRSLLDIELNNATDYVRHVLFADSIVEGFGNYLLANGGAGISEYVTLQGVESDLLKIRVGQSLDETGNPRWSRFFLSVLDCVGRDPIEGQARPVVQAQGLTGLVLRGNTQNGNVLQPGYQGTVQEPIDVGGNSWDV